MKKLINFSLIVIVSMLCISMRGNAQWVQTNGPYGGSITCFVKSGNYIYAGSFGRVFRSSDNGGNWEKIAKGLPEATISYLTEINKKLYVGTYNDTYILSDIGNEWVKWGPGSSSLITKGTSLFLSNSSGVWTSTNNGKDWHSINKGLTYYQGSNEYVLRVNSIVSSGNALIVATADSGIYRSTDNGLNWTKVRNGVRAITYYDLKVSENIIFAGGISGVFLSTDNGESWKNAGDGLNGSTVYKLAEDNNNIISITFEGMCYITSNQGNSWHLLNDAFLLDRRISAIYAEGLTLFAGCGRIQYYTDGAGIIKSSDLGLTWISTNNRLTNTTAISMIANDSVVYVGTDGGSIQKTTDNGLNWITSLDIYSGRSVKALYSHENNIYAAISFIGVVRSSDYGEKWIKANTGINNNIVTDFIAIRERLFASAQDGTGAGGVYLLDTDNMRWIKLTDKGAHSLAIFDTLLFAGGEEDVFLSTDYGLSWTTKKNGLPKDKEITKLLALDTYLFAVVNQSGIYVSTDKGDSWVSVNNGLPIFLNNQGNIFYYTISDLASNGHNIFASTQGAGVYLTKDSGANWKNISTELINDTAITSLATSNTQLFIGTRNGVVWRRSLLELSTIKQNSILTGNSYPNPFTASTTISFTLPKRDMVTIEVFDILGRKIQTLASEVMDAGPHSVLFNGENLPLGMYTVRITSGASSEEMKVVLSK